MYSTTFRARRVRFPAQRVRPAGAIVLREKFSLAQTLHCTASAEASTSAPCPLGWASSDDDEAVPANHLAGPGKAGVDPHSRARGPPITLAAPPSMKQVPADIAFTAASCVGPLRILHEPQVDARLPQHRPRRRRPVRNRRDQETRHGRAGPRLSLGTVEFRRGQRQTRSSAPSRDHGQSGRVFSTRRRCPLGLRLCKCSSMRQRRGSPVLKDLVGCPVCERAVCDPASEIISARRSAIGID